MQSRRAFAVASSSALATIGLLRFPAGAAEFSYKLNHDRPATDPIGILLAASATKIFTESGGRLDIKVFALNALGGDAKLLASIREGAVEFGFMVDTITANVVPAASLSAVGFAFPDLESAWNALDGSCGAFIRDQIQKQTGVYSFSTAWDGGFKEISNSLRPIATPDDLKGLKIRVPPGPIAVSLYKTLGASPTAIDVTEQYTAAQTHLLDGADTSASLLLSSKLYEVQKYLSITNHSLIAWHLLAAPGPWQALPKNLRDLTEQTFNAASKVNRRQEERDFDGVVATLKSHGLLVNEPNTAPFRAALRTGGYYSYWKDKFGAQGWAALEKGVGRLS